MKKGIIIVMSLALIATSSCKKKGCTDIAANNYSEKAKKDNGSCDYSPVLYEGGNVTTNTIFTDKNIKICEDIVVEAELTIPAGTTIIMCAGASIEVKSTGSINAVGTATEPIVIKGETQTKGFWEGIAIKSNNLNNKFDYVTVSDAGTYWGWEYANVYVGDGAKLAISNSTISNSDNVGMFVEDNVTLSTFSNNTFSNNTTGLNIGVYQLGQIDGASNYNSNNTNDFIFVRSGNLTTNATWPKTTTPILLNGTSIEAGLTLTPGSTILIEAGGGIVIQSTGYLTSMGTATAPIVIKGRYASAGFWDGLAIKSNNPNNKMAYTTVSDGGSYWNYEYANIYIVGGRLDLDNCTISNANSYGVYVRNSSSIYTSGSVQTAATGVEANNTFTSNGNGPDANCTTGCTVFFQ